MTINYQYKNIQSPTKITLTDEQSAGHADHWRILTDDMSQDVPEWLQKMIEKAAMPKSRLVEKMPLVTVTETSVKVPPI